jgi:hypothetical protein
VNWRTKINSKKNTKRKIKILPIMEVTDKGGFFRLLRRAIFLPASPRKLAPRKPALLDNAT